MADFNPSYIGLRDDILKLIPDRARKILDVGCSTGVLGEKIKQRKGTEVIGIEFDEQMAKIARENLDEVIVGDVEKINLEEYFAAEYFDCIIFADILEHLINPSRVLRNSINFLKKGGIVIVSVPNVRHFSTIATLVFKGYWPYEERGIHDKSHLRFFTLKNIIDLLQEVHLNILKIERKYRIFESPRDFNKYAKCLALPGLKDFLTFQYRILAKK